MPVTRVEVRGMEIYWFGCVSQGISTRSVQEALGHKLWEAKAPKLTIQGHIARLLRHDTPSGKIIWKKIIVTQ